MNKPPVHQPVVVVAEDGASVTHAVCIGGGTGPYVTVAMLDPRYTLPGSFRVDKQYLFWGEGLSKILHLSRWARAGGMKLAAVTPAAADALNNAARGTAMAQCHENLNALQLAVVRALAPTDGGRALTTEECLEIFHLGRDQLNDLLFTAQQGLDEPEVV